MEVIALIDILAFGAHPDDVELNVGGTLILHARQGLRVGVVDLSLGELASNGTVEERQKESLEAASYLQLTLRENLALPDGGIADNQSQRLKVAGALRRLRPEVVLLPSRGARHPDHRAASQLIESAVHLAGVKGYSLPGNPYRPRQLFFYAQSRTKMPELVVDVSGVYEQKLQAILSHASQFINQEGEAFPTTINSPQFLQIIRSRDQFYGSLIGSLFGEGFFQRGPVPVDNLMDSLQ